VILPFHGEGKAGTAKIFFGVMKLRPLKGDITKITANGSDEAAAIKAANDFFRDNL
jgi:phosphotransferase system HPr-like phosphotransfer protein